MYKAVGVSFPILASRQALSMCSWFPAENSSSSANSHANLYVEQDQLQDAGIGNIYQSRLGDKKRVQRSKEIGYEIEDILNPTEYNDFAKYFMSRPKSEQSYIMGLGYKEGGIASLNVKK